MNVNTNKARLAIDAAQQMVTDLCKRPGEPGWKRWIMSIPAQPERDPDLVIAAALCIGTATCDELDRTRTERNLARIELAAARAILQELRPYVEADEWGTPIGMLGRIDAVLHNAPAAPGKDTDDE